MVKNANQKIGVAGAYKVMIELWNFPAGDVSDTPSLADVELKSLKFAVRERTPPMSSRMMKKINV